MVLLDSLWVLYGIYLSSGILNNDTLLSASTRVHLTGVEVDVRFDSTTPALAVGDVITLIDRVSGEFDEKTVTVGTYTFKISFTDDLKLIAEVMDKTSGGNDNVAEMLDEPASITMDSPISTATVEIVDITLSPEDYLGETVTLRGQLFNVNHNHEYFEIYRDDNLRNRVAVLYSDLPREQQRQILLANNHSELEIVGEVIQLTNGAFVINASSVREIQ